MARGQGFSLDKAAKDYGVSRRASQQKFLTGQSERATEAMKAFVDALQKKISKKKHGFGKDFGWFKTAAKWLGNIIVPGSGQYIDLALTAANEGKKKKQYKDLIKDLDVDYEAPAWAKDSFMEDYMTEIATGASGQGKTYVESAKKASDLMGNINMLMKAAPIASDFAGNIVETGELGAGIPEDVKAGDIDWSKVPEGDIPHMADLPEQDFKPTLEQSRELGKDWDFPRFTSENILSRDKAQFWKPFQQFASKQTDGQGLLPSLISTLSGGMIDSENLGKLTTPIGKAGITPWEIGYNIGEAPLMDYLVQPPQRGAITSLKAPQVRRPQIRRGGVSYG